MPDRKRPSSADPQVLALFQEEMARAAAMPCLAPPGPSLWPRFAGYYQGLGRLPRRLRRQLQRRCRRSLAGIALLLALGQAPAFAATLTVVPGVAPDIAPDGACSLIEAIENANADARTHADCPAGSGADTIVLPASSTQTLAAVHDGSFGGPTGLPVVSSAISIEGNGTTIIRAGTAPEFRIFTVDSIGNLTLNETTVSGGVADGRNGGGIANYSGTVTLTSSAISGNSARGDLCGAGVFNDGTATLMNTTVSGNTAHSCGGGVFNSGTVTLTNTTVSGNSARNGGGVDNGGTATLTNTTVSGNTAVGGPGGGVRNYGAATLTDSTVSGNSAGGSGGGVTNGGTVTLAHSTVSGNTAVGFPGGGVDNFGTATLTNTTVSGNSASGGGGVANTGTATLTNSTVSGNSASFPGGGVRNYGTATLARSLVTGNTGPQAGEVYNRLGNVIANNFNLFGHSGSAGVGGFILGATDIVPIQSVTAILDTTLGNNGGPTKTHALVFGSPALDAVGTGCPPPATDQRDVARPQDGDGDAVAECDVGAFEGVVGSLPPPPLPPAPPAAPSPPAPPPAPDADTAPLGLSNPQPFGCEFAGDEIACAETSATLPFIRFDVDIPENAGFLQFDYTFTGADRAVSGADSVDIVGRSNGENQQRASIGDLGAVFVVNVPIAALPASGVRQEGVFQNSGQSGLPRSSRGTLIVANFPSDAPGSVFRVRNLRVDRCAQKCFGKRATLCGTDGRDKLTGTRRRDVIVGRDGNDTIKGRGGNDLICGGEGKDKILGGPGSDRLDGGLGRDTCDGGEGTDGTRRCDRKRAIP